PPPPVTVPVTNSPPPPVLPSASGVLSPPGAKEASADLSVGADSDPSAIARSPPPPTVAASPPPRRPPPPPPPPPTKAPVKKPKKKPPPKKKKKSMSKSGSGGGATSSSLSADVFGASGAATCKLGVRQKCLTRLVCQDTLDVAGCSCLREAGSPSCTITPKCMVPAACPVE
ncbi:unnamed protein product, partial [Closterium sp. NIES-54]